MDFPTLYKLTSTGKVQMWEIVSNPEDHLDAAIVTTYGLLDGKKQTATEYISEGKNIGKANETTPMQQACAEARSQWEQKKKKGYVESIDDAQAGQVDTTMITGGIAPMLAHSYEKQGHKIKYPAYTQPKLDGHRCIAIIQNGKCTLWSRTQKKITGVPHIQRQLEKLIGPTANVILDGELYNHDYCEKFEELTSFIRQETPKPGHEVVQFWIYDLPTENTNETRVDLLKLLDMTIKHHNDLHQLKIVETSVADTEEEMIDQFGIYINFGFEGLMVRNKDGIYKNRRSYDLQKVKTMEDAEFEIVGITEGKGKMAGKGLFVCKTDSGEEFSVKMVGNLDSLSKYLDNKEDYIGKQLTVKYQELTKPRLVPRFPVALRIKEDI